ncbi:kelch-like protein 4 isoform 3-T3 [Hipposideros larvatus]
MSIYGKKEFDVKQILRLRWRWFSHPSQGSPSPGNCFQQEGYELRGTPVQGRLKSHSRDRNGLKKSSSPVRHNVLAPVPGPAPAHEGAFQNWHPQNLIGHLPANEDTPKAVPEENLFKRACEKHSQDVEMMDPGSPRESIRPLQRSLAVRFNKEVFFTSPDIKNRLITDRIWDPTWGISGVSHQMLTNATLVRHKLHKKHPEEINSSISEKCHVLSHADITLCKMESYLKERQLCDVLLIAGHLRIPAHRLVLCAVSDYFDAMFTNDMLEAKQEEIKMEGVDPNALNSLVQYAYTGVLQLEEDTVENLMSAACLLQDYFFEVIKNEEFLLLPVNELSELLCSDDINVPDEETIFHALMKWVGHDVKARQQGLAKLLSYIRLPLLPTELLADLENNPMFTGNLECQKLLIEAMKYHLLPERRSMMQSPRTKPRKSTVGALYAVGGMDALKGTTTIEKYDLRTDIWLPVGTMSGRRLQFGVAVINNNLIVVGGRDGLKTLNTVECFNPVSKVWTVMPPLSTHRHGLGVAVLEGPMYAVGGHDGWSYLNTVERWDPQACQWNYVASMSTARSTVGVVALNNKLYAIGGRDGSSCLRTMEYFDPHTNKWNLCSPMSKRRGCVAAATYNGFIYVVGGHDAPTSNHCSRLHDCVERYDPKYDLWSTVAPLSFPRDSVALCTLGDKLYVVGGYDGHAYLNTVESYDPQKDEWKQEIPVKMPRAGASVVVIKLP